MSSNSGSSAVGRTTSPTSVSRNTALSEGDPTDDNDGVGIIVVDHGSRSADANLRHERFVARWQKHSRYRIVASAHMEFAQPSISSAVDACVAAGASNIVILPLFLWPGMHLERDIPALVARSASHHPGVAFAVGPPLGAHPLLFEIVDDHTAECLDRLPIREARLRAGLTQVELGERIGQSQSVVARWERGVIDEHLKVTAERFADLQLDRRISND